MESGLPFYTIGHSTRSIQTFVRLLAHEDITVVADVRAIPRSRTNPQYNMESLPGALARYGIGYQHFAQLGGRRRSVDDVDPDINAYWENASFHHYADYALGQAFHEGLGQLQRLGGKRRCAIMCAETLWWRCHRRLIADYLLARGETVFHILGEEQMQPAKMTPAARKGPDNTLVYPRKPADDEATVANVTITHSDRVLWPDGGITKLELARYYAAVAPKLLAYAGNRPISLVRCPKGQGRQCFFQRHPGEGMASHVHSIKIAGRGDGKPFIFIHDAEGLVSLVQMGTIELHAWNSPASNAKQPDRLIFDLDPADDIKWDAVKEAARDVRDALGKLGLVSFLKTTGGKGLHVVVPFAPGPSWADTKRFARAFSDTLAKAEPDRFTINARKDMRPGHIFLDYLRNDETASAVAAYSVRARPGAPISLPIDWKGLSRVKSGDAFKIKDGLKRRQDPWMDMTKVSRQPLPLEK